MTGHRPLSGTRIAVTRSTGTGATLARRIRRLGGTPLLLPGSSLREASDTTVAKALREALACDIAVFTSPAAVRFARRLGPWRGSAEILAPGAGTQRALRRAGFADVGAPLREDSEGLLSLAALRNVRGKRIGIIGAAGGRGLLDRELAARGAEILHAHVYRRLPARIDRRHVDALLREPRKPLYVLLSSAEALSNILAALRGDPRTAFIKGTAVVSSARLATAARTVGFARVLRASSANAQAMLGAVILGRPR